MRRDKCKCGKFIVWDPETDNEAVCKGCKTVYTVEADSVLIYWREEKMEKQSPYKTEAR